MWSDDFTSNDAYVWSDGYLWSDAYLWSDGLTDTMSINVWVDPE
jgi:hypothetical protein